MAIHTVLPNLHLVDIDLPLPGFRSFISAWILRQGDQTVVVDPGPRAGIPALLAALGKLGVERIDLILLTHIHLDHAGGAGLLAARYPEARFVCHADGIRHLVDPTKLWAGSRKVLGEVADAYGSVAPIPAERIGCPMQFLVDSTECEVIVTPGHAPHHLCYRIGDTLFAGEVAGITCPATGPRYQRPATPPVFKLEVFRDSIERVGSLGARRLCLGHYGHTLDVHGFLHTALAQVDRWLEVVGLELRRDGEGWAERSFARLLVSDPALASYPALPADVRERERYFALNSLRGLAGYLSPP